MQDILDALYSIADALFSVLEVIGDFINDLVWTVELLGKAILNVPNYISWLPKPLIAIVMGCFSVVIIYKVLGREG